MAKRAKATDFGPGAQTGADSQAAGTQVVERILELIRTGILRAGDRIPPERELIEIFSISRPSLREALRALATLGVVKSRQGGGAYVSDLHARTLLAPLDFFLSLTQANLADAFDSRLVIETEIVRRAAERASRSDEADLAEIIAAHEAVRTDPLGFRILDSRFHEKLSTIAGNAVLQRIAYGLYNLGLDFQFFDKRTRDDPGLIAQSTADHTAIAAAIRAHDAEAAGKAMAAHIRNIEASTLSVIARETSALQTPSGLAPPAIAPPRAARKRTTQT